MDQNGDADKIAGHGMVIDLQNLLSGLSMRIGFDFDQKPLIAIMKLHKYKKGEFFCKQGDSCPFMGIVDEGAFKVFYSDHDGKEYVRALPSRCDSIGPLSDILQGTSSSVNIQALSDSTVARVDFSEFRALCGDPQYVSLYLKILELKYVEKERRTFELISNRAHERMKFLKSLPKFVTDHASHADLASYLNMTPETFSRSKNHLKTET